MRLVSLPATTVLLIGALASASAPAATINLLPLGDSITAQALYFAPLQNLLTGAGISSDVIANEGYSGYIIDGSLPGAPRNGLAENIGVGKNPDFLSPPPPIPAPVNAANTYILLMIGTNDVDTGFDLSTAQLQSRMSNLISEIRTEAPLAHLIVAEIVPNLDAAGKDAAVDQFNSAIAGVVTGPNVSLVDMHQAFEPNPAALMMADGLHPNQAGGDVMAQVWFQGILAAQQQVPEPSSMILCGLGAFGLLLVALRRRTI